MDDNLQSVNDEEMRCARAARRRAEMRREKERQQWVRSHMMIFALAGMLVLVGIYALVRVILPSGQKEISMQDRQPEAEERYETANDTDMEAADGDAGLDRMENLQGDTRVVDSAGDEQRITTDADVKPASDPGMVRVGDVLLAAGYEAHTSSETVTVFDEENVQSRHVILIDGSTGEIVARRDADTIIAPASMTKILTLLVAVEHLSDLDEKVTITIQDTDYAFRNDCSVVGFEVDEVIPVRDLLYGTILPSGGDAAIALARHVAGSEENFATMMNEKLKELGLAKTAHFTNCVGLFDEEHYCTIYDMAMILKAAIENDICREVLNAHTYTTSATSQHPEGLLISNWFLRRIEDKDTKGEVLCAKTGFVNESGSCAASYEVTDTGIPYICVTADAHSSWRCIYDHVAMYQTYTK
ncbi:MAG: D-alanyl-D-alanine carboxypeptidase [Lachnospiraceae bacterium]|nr:D-alanyl-D-alanine carboxypeptidase [Lachnospiraceae bacterium]